MASPLADGYFLRESGKQAEAKMYKGKSEFRINLQN